MTTQAPGASRQERHFREALDRFKDAGLPDGLLEEFQFTALDDLRLAIEKLQNEQASKDKMRNLNRVKMFLEGMDEYGKVIEVFLNASSYLAFVWGPMKFLLQVTSTYVKAFDVILDLYNDIGEYLPFFTQYEDLFQNNQHMIRVLGLIYSDILDFHAKAVRYFKQKFWRKLFDATWSTFRTRFGGLKDNFRRHRLLIESQANLVQYDQIMQTRSDAEESFRILREGEKRRQRTAIRDWLAAANMSVEQAYFRSVRETCPRSGAWLLKKQLVKTWLNADATSIPTLWLTGIPGSGKSTLVSLLVEEASNLPQSKTVFFYCKNNDCQRNSLLAMLRSLIQQIVQDDDDLVDFVDAKASKSGETCLTSLSLAKEILETALQRHHTAYIIVDGIDECVKNEKKLIISYFLGLRHKNESDDKSDDLSVFSSGTSLRIFFASQEDNDCAKPLKALPTVRISVDDNRSDLEEFCRHWEKRIADKHTAFAFQPGFVAPMVTKLAGDMWLFARLIMENIYEQTSPYRAQAEVDVLNQPNPNYSFSEKLDIAYGRILHRILDDAPLAEREDAKRLLGWLCFAKRQLQWHEIQGAMSIDVESRTVDFKMRGLSLDAKDLCGSLVEIRPSNIVTLVHTTARQYLIDKCIVSAHTESLNFARLLLAYLSFDCFLVSSYQEVEELTWKGCYAFFHYSIIHWLDHLEDFATELENEPLMSIGGIVDDISKFLIVHFRGHKLDKAPTKSNKLKSQQFKKACGPLFEELIEVSTTWRFLLSPKANKSYEMSLPIHEVAENIRLVLDNMGTRGICQTAEDYQRMYYGDSLFRCRRMDCAYFHRGFRSHHDRDHHSSFHERVYYCNFLGCPKYLLGFGERGLLESHLVNDHSVADSHLQFPIHQQPVSIDLRAAIKNKDWEAVARWTEKYSDMIPDKDIGISSEPNRRQFYFTWYNSRDILQTLLDTQNLPTIELLFSRLQNPAELWHDVINVTLSRKLDLVLDWVTRQEPGVSYPPKVFHLIRISMSNWDDSQSLKIMRFYDRAQVTLKEDYQNRLMVYAARYGRLECLKHMIDTWKARVNLPDKYKKTPLMYAAENGHLSIIQVLLSIQSPEEVFAKNSMSESAPMLAAANGHENILREILGMQTELIAFWLPVLYLRKAARIGDTAQVRRLLADKALLVDLSDIEGYTPFLHAVENGHSEIVELLLNHAGETTVDVNQICLGRAPQKKYGLWYCQDDCGKAFLPYEKDFVVKGSLR